VCRAGTDGQRRPDLLDSPWSAKTRIFEYGGRSFIPVPVSGGWDLVFANSTDQRLYRQKLGSEGVPGPLTPVPVRRAGLRFGDMSVDAINDRIVAVCERHEGDGTHGTVRRSLVAIPLDGSAAEDPGKMVVLARGYDFYHSPRVSPDGRRLVYVAWNHPNMPWDRTVLFESRFDGAGQPVRTQTLAAYPHSIMDPGFLRSGPHAGKIVVITDQRGWWQPAVVDGTTGETEFLSDVEADFTRPLWDVGLRSWVELSDGSLLVTPDQTPSRLWPDGSITPLDRRWTGYIDMAADADHIALVVGGDSSPTTVTISDAAMTRWRTVVPVHEANATPADPGPVRRLVAGIPCVFYPPEHHDHPLVGAPYVVWAHGGPTFQHPGLVAARTAYLTSNGIGVVAVDYAGSSGYGRRYRQQLVGRWGDADVADVVAVASALIHDGTFTAGRVGISGASAGGWTVLATLTTPGNPFSAGVSIYGVVDCRSLGMTTHDYESCYLPSLPTPGPAGWYDRPPIERSANLTAPVLLLQGADDRIVTPDQARAFATACATEAKACELVVFPGEGHGFRGLGTIAAALRAELDFYRRAFDWDPPLESPHPRSAADLVGEPWRRWDQSQPARTAAHQDDPSNEATP
jgi:dipeptidyl aminopeptidase/acylaminoacyl peptidase